MLDQVARERQPAMATTAEDRKEWWAVSGQAQLRQLLFWLWDPIGVNGHFPNTLDEYDRYADAMRDLMVGDADEEALAAGVLQAARRAQAAMGFENKQTAEEDRRNLTEMILGWRHDSIALWKEYGR